MLARTPPDVIQSQQHDELLGTAHDAAHSVRTVPFTLVSPPTAGSPAASPATVLHGEETPAGDDGDLMGVGASPLALAPAHNQGTSRGRMWGRHMVDATDDAALSALPAPHAKLVIERGRSAGKSFLINDAEAHIGRWDADGGIFPDIDLDADDPEAKVSRRHARLLRRPDGYFIEDLGSTNGTFVNRGRRLLPGAPQPLQDGDELIVGKTFLRLHVIK